MLLIMMGLVAGCVSLSSCSEKEFKYNYTENGCSTDDHEFDSKDEYCDGLKDDGLNKGCAVGMRKDAFSRDCQGKAWS